MRINNNPLNGVSVIKLFTKNGKFILSIILEYFTFIKYLPNT